MTDMVQKGEAKAYTVIPPLISPFKTGSQQKDSDIDEVKEEEDEEEGDDSRDKGYPRTENLRRSVRAALKEKFEIVGTSQNTL
jgi:hypothetical protein